MVIWQKDEIFCLMATSIIPSRRVQLTVDLWSHSNQTKPFSSCDCQNFWYLSLRFYVSHHFSKVFPLFPTHPFIILGNSLKRQICLVRISNYLNILFLPDSPCLIFSIASGKNLCSDAAILLYILFSFSVKICIFLSEMSECPP